MLLSLIWKIQPSRTRASNMLITRGFLEKSQVSTLFQTGIMSFHLCRKNFCGNNWYFKKITQGTPETKSKDLEKNGGRGAAEVSEMLMF